VSAVAAPAGELRLTVGPDHRGRTAIRARRQRFPLRTTVPFYLDAAAPGMAFVYIQNPTGGVFAGDRLIASVVAEPGARVHMTTQSATKLYRCETAPAHQELCFVIGAGAYVEYVPDPLIPQAGSRYTQSTSVEVANGAMFVACETIAPGRRARGERFAYDLLDLDTSVRREGRELCAERLRLEPRWARPDRPGVLGDSDYLVSLIAVAPEADGEALARTIGDALAGQAAAGVRGAAGELPNGAGALARILAADAVSAHDALRSAWAAARLALLGLPLPERRK
jgi:urease accessory protein